MVRTTTRSRRRRASRRRPSAPAFSGRDFESGRSSSRSMAMAECEHLGRTSAYFDGELADAEHADALAHLAECAECQRLLGTAVSLDAASSERPRTETLSPPDAL